MSKFLTAVAAFGLALYGGAANANITFTANQGLQSNGFAVPANRSNTASMVDGNTGTFYSLGISGTLLASIAPQLIAAASVIEVTFSNTPLYPESAKVYLGSNASGTLLGELFNTASGTSVTSAGGATITASANTPPGNGLTSFQINLGALAGTASSLFFVDTTATNFAVTPGLRPDSDGFDIAELNISPVPLPAGILLLGLGLAGFGGVRAVQARRKVA